MGAAAASAGAPASGGSAAAASGAAGPAGGSRNLPGWAGPEGWRPRRGGGMTSAAIVKDDPDLMRMVRALKEALGPRLRNVVLYGSAARGDYHKARSDMNLLLVLEDLGVATL